jgi:hypothetical protein
MLGWEDMSTPESWVRFQATQENIALSKKRRLEKDQIYTNLYVEAPTDSRWIGELGEIYFDQWINNENVPNAEWLMEKPLGNPDFIINGNRIDVKTVKRKDQMHPSYGVQVSSKQIATPMDDYFFICYLTSTRMLLLLGGITKPRFLESSQTYSNDQKVHSEYLIRHDHSINNCDYSAPG